MRELYLDVANKYHYNHENGSFYRRLVRGRLKKYTSKTSSGCCARIGVMFDGMKKSVKLHRLAWFMHTGELPDVIQHINGDVTDNRIKNLRAIAKTTKCTISWHGRRYDGGYIGVFKDRFGGFTWNLRNNNIRYYKSWYSTALGAHRARLNKMKELNVESL